MTGTTSVPGGARRPGPSRPRHLVRHDDDGAVAVEAAFGIAGLVLVALCLAWCLALVGGELAMASATRAAARVAARGEGVEAVVREARRLVPDADVTVRVDGDHVLVEGRRQVSPPGILARLGAVHLEARSVAVLEQS